MKLRELLQQLEDVRRQIEVPPVFVCGGTPRDKFMGRLDNVADIDLTNGTSTIDYLSQQFYEELRKKYNIVRKTMDDGHSSIFIGNLKVDFSSNFVVPDVDQYLREFDITKPTDMQREMFSRDFTCNALLLTIDLKDILDPTKRGFQDIRAKQIKTCLSPEITLTSNRNRVVRAIYLACKLGFDIDPDIINYVKEYPQIVRISTQKTTIEKLDKAFEKDPERASHLISQMNLWSHFPITDKMQPYYAKRVTASAQFKDYLVTWTDIYGKQKMHHAKLKNPTEDEGVISIPHRGDIFKKLDKIEEAIFDSTTQKWIPKPKPFVHSKIPIIEGPNNDFLEYSSEFVPNQGEILNFDTAHSIAISLLKDRPDTVIYHEGGNNWAVGKMDPVKKSAYFQGGGGVNQPEPHHQKYTVDKLIEIQSRFIEPFYVNYDLYDVSGVDSPNVPAKHGPGPGWSHIEEHKNIKDFLECRRKHMDKRHIPDDFYIENTWNNYKQRVNRMKLRAKLLQGLVKLAGNECADVDVEYTDRRDAWFCGKCRFLGPNSQVTPKPTAKQLHTGTNYNDAGFDWSNDGPENANQHFETRCKNCHTVVAQCRCSLHQNDKEIRYVDACSKCRKVASDENDGPNFDYGKGLYSNMDKYKSVKDFEEYADKGPGAFFADDNADHMLPPKEHGTQIYDWKNSPYQGTPKAPKCDDNDIDFPIDEQVSPILGDSGSSYIDSIPISYQENYTAEPDQDGKSESTLDFGYDLTNEDASSGRFGPDFDEVLKKLTDKYLVPDEGAIYGLPDGVDSEDKDAEQTVQTENPDFGITDSGRQMYEDKWNI